MADFYEVWRFRDSVLAKLEAMLKDQEAMGEQELKAATAIKRFYRAKIFRYYFCQKRKSIILIAKTFRGYRGRLRAQQALEKRHAKEAMAVYHHHALVIQGTFRGFHSRKYNFDYAGRKRYLQEVIDAGNAVRARLRRHEVQLLQEEAARTEQTQLAELQAIAQNLHHLVSTKTIRGVFNSPYARGSGRVRTIQGIAVEQHLTISAKDLLRSRGYLKRGLETDLNGQRRVPLRGLESRRSVQAQDHYDSHAQAVALDQAISRLKMIGPQEFHAGNRVHLSSYKRGINEGAPFIDPWRNPYMMRGVPRDQAEMSRPVNEITLGKYPEKPFYLSVGGNKSAVLPNGIFDVILDAEKTGGIVRTHNGRTRRFGVPDTCDVDDGVRVAPSSTLFFPPAPPGKRLQPAGTR
ncbi:unnamed protein product [Ascophyllum nodosum]